MPNHSPHVDADYRLPVPDIVLVDGVPHAADFEDGYYSAQDGLAESRHVFLDGNGLSSRLGDGGHFVIAETGFGTGLNLLALMVEMKRHPNCQVDFVSIEGFPLEEHALAAAHAQFPEITEAAADLRRALPPRWPGYHITSLCEGRLTLHLHYGDVGSVLPELAFQADAWFLDGFAPARNPEMWNEGIMNHIGRLTSPGGTLASFTSAGYVRRGLITAGFDIEKRPGFGRKREMIAGVKPGCKAGQAQPRSIGIVGGGVAGAATAAALSRRGAQVTLIDNAKGLGQAGSGNRMALQSPRLTIDHNAMSRLSASCLAYASRLSDLTDATLYEGVVALDSPEKMARRHNVFRQQKWPETLLCAFDGREAGLGRGLYYPMGRVIRPEILLGQLAAGAEQVFNTDIQDVSSDDGDITLTTADGRVLTFDALVLAAGAGMNSLLGRLECSLPLEITSGQVSHVPEGVISDREIATHHGVSFGGYLTPPLDGHHDLGATFHKQAYGEPPSIAAGHAHNVGLLPAGLRGGLETDFPPFGARVGERASLPDRRPAFGRVTKSVFVLGGLGARGFTLAPMLAELLAADILGHAMPLAQSQAAGVRMSRYSGR